jgi:putative PIN family toxin of toxin-antitoxin system
MIVLDTNIVLDLFVFNDPASEPLKRALQAHQVRWIATQAMREELARVLAYPQILPRLALCRIDAAAVLALFDRHAQLMPAPARAAVTCADADDQKFIDLAVAHRATLLSKDRAVLGMAKRLSALAVSVQAVLDEPQKTVPNG